MKLATYKAKERLTRAMLGLRFIVGTWTEDDAQKVRWAAQNREGFYPLLAISKTRLKDELAEICADLPDNIDQIAHSAVSRTADKWASDGEDYYAAMDTARERATD